jgi:hypothetical protein
MIIQGIESAFEGCLLQNHVEILIEAYDLLENSKPQKSLCGATSPFFEVGVKLENEGIDKKTKTKKIENSIEPTFLAQSL